MEWMILFVALLSFIWGVLRDVMADEEDSWTVVDRDGESVDVLNRYIYCNGERDAYRRARDKGLGSPPVLLSPTRTGDSYHQYRIGNHELVYEDGRFIDYRWVFVAR